MNIYDTLDKLERVPLETVSEYYINFIHSCVQKERKQRWLEFALKPKKIYEKFNSLWQSLELSKLEQLDSFELQYPKYIYFDLDNEGYIFPKDIVSQFEFIKDGFLFSLCRKETIFLTHESIYYRHRF